MIDAFAAIRVLTMPDIFISYTQADREWAEQLDRDLSSKYPNLDVFLDTERLQAGEGWRPQLTRALQSTKHLVVLWSSHAADINKPWVLQELTYFERAIGQNDAQLAATHQRIIVVQLDRELTTYNDLQQITTLNKGSVRAAGLPALLANNRALWDKAVSEVYFAATGVKQVPIPLLLLAATRDELASVDWTQPPPFNRWTESLDGLSGKLGITREIMLAQYGPQRADWRPFGGGGTIWQLLERDQVEINGFRDATPFRWVHLDEQLLAGSRNQARAELRRVLEPNTAVIVIDPISLHVGAIHQRFGLLKDLEGLNNPKAAIVVPAPMSLSSVGQAYRAGLSQLAADLYDDYYQPGVRHIPHARCHVSFGDEYDLKRSVTEIVRSHVCRINTRPLHGALTV